jgi:hypothetical protein
MPISEPEYSFINSRKACPECIEGAPRPQGKNKMQFQVNKNTLKTLRSLRLCEKKHEMVLAC